MPQTRGNGYNILTHNRSKPRIHIERLSSTTTSGSLNTYWATAGLSFSFKKLFKTLHAHGLDSLFSYPATRLAKLPWPKLALKFTDEVVLVLLAIVLIVANVSINPHQDSSLFAQSLANHADSNIALHTKIFSNTTNQTGSKLISEALAEEQRTVTPTTQVAGMQEQVSSITSIDEYGLSAAIPDSIKPLLNNQIRIHKTASGETLSDIADQYNIDVNTIKWSNGLTSNIIKPDWFLVIPSVKGVLVQADNDTTITGIARKFKCSEESIISYNGLDGADSVEPGQYIICPGGRVAETVKRAETQTSRNVGVNYASIPDLPGTVNSFVKGNCTWYVAKKMKISFHGNANQWLKNAPKAGYSTGRIPQAGSAVVTSLSGKYGHVAFVETVNHDNTITISEMNYEGLGQKSTRTIAASDVVGFIYPKE